MVYGCMKGAHEGGAWLPNGYLLSNRTSTLAWCMISSIDIGMKARERELVELAIYL